MRKQERRGHSMHRSSVLLSIAIELTIYCVGQFLLHIVYRRGVRRCARNIKAAYAAEFEDRAWIARSLDENLAQAIHRSQCIVNAMRSSARDASTMKSGFNQVLYCLDVAAEEGDTALRSLEKSSQRDPVCRHELERQWTRPNKSPS